MKTLATLCGLLWVSALLFAQAPESFKYQAVLRDAAGNVKANAATTIQLAILQGSVSGASVYNESHAVTTTEFGLVNLTVGAGSSKTGNIAAIDWSSGSYFLKVTVDGTDFGTSQLLSVPYAMYAKTAGNQFSGKYEDLSNKPTLATVATSGSYADLLSKPALFSGSYIDLSNKPTLFSGSYTDLTNKPALFNGTWSTLTGKPTTISGFGITDAFSGSYSDLTNKPNLFSGSYTDLTNKPALFNGTWSTLTGKPTTISGFGITDAFSGNYVDLTNKPTLFSGSYTDLTNKPTLFNGNWSTLTGKPTTISGYGITDAMNISHPANSINSINITNWNTAYGWGNHSGLYRPISYFPAWTDVTGKPSFAIVATSGSYSDLTNKPIIDGSETKIIAGTNIILTGLGSTVNPYIIGSINSSITYTVGLNTDMGGYIFYVTSDGKHGLVAATQDQYPTTSWYRASELINDPVYHNNAGKGFTDWRLPKVHELGLMYNLKTAIGGFVSNFYWSSSEYDSNYAWIVDFNGTGAFFDTKGKACRIRAVRSF